MEGKFLIAAAVVLLSLAGCAKKVTVVEEDIVEDAAVQETTVTEAEYDTADAVGNDSRSVPVDLDTSVASDDSGDESPQFHAAVPVPTDVRPVSTFSIDVDTASYSRARRALRDGQLPEPTDVRTEEFLNYFDYAYPPPSSGTMPFSTTVDVGPAPWAGGKHLMLVGLKGYEVPAARLPPANLVFLVDTSYSMIVPDRLPLLVESLRGFTQILRPQDRVSIVTYAGHAGVVLPATPGDQKARIAFALGELDIGSGGTDGSAGIKLAYSVARENFIAGGVNRVILATDGDFNVGLATPDALEPLIEKEREGGISLTVLGFGDSSLGDRIAERLADKGNGNYAFIDDDLEADKVLRREMGATLLTIASDVKVQVEFNPQLVRDYRLLGYANRVLRNEQFSDDSVDAGEIGAGHDVTALYEITLAGSGPAALTSLGPEELARVRSRFKRPGESESALIERSVTKADVRPLSKRLHFASAVAAFAERLAGRGFEGYGFERIAEAARTSQLPDPLGERAEMADLAEVAGALLHAARYVD
jgi:Ca-activated chloride channel family protein